MSERNIPTLEELRKHKVLGNALSHILRPDDKRARSLWSHVMEDKSQTYFTVNMKNGINVVLSCMVGLYFDKMLCNLFDLFNLEREDKEKVLNAFNDVMSIDNITEDSHILKELYSYTTTSHIKEKIRSMVAIGDTGSERKIFLTNNSETQSNVNANTYIFDRIDFNWSIDDIYNAQRLKDIIVFSLKPSNRSRIIRDVSGWSGSLRASVESSKNILSLVEFYENCNIVIVELSKNEPIDYYHQEINQNKPFSQLTKNLKQDKEYLGIMYNELFYNGIESGLAGLRNNSIFNDKDSVCGVIRHAVYGKESLIQVHL